MPPISDQQRRTMAAIGLLEGGASAAAATAKLQARFPGLTPGEVADTIRRAQGAIGNAVGVSLSDNTDTVASAVGRPGDDNATYTAEFTVKIDAPGRETEYRTVRIRTTGSETVGELNQLIQDQVDEWDEQYDVDGRSSSWSLRFIL